MMSLSNNTSTALLLLQSAFPNVDGGSPGSAVGSWNTLDAIVKARLPAKPAPSTTVTPAKASPAVSMSPLANTSSFASNVVVATTLEPGSKEDWDAQIDRAVQLMKDAAQAVACVNAGHHPLEKISQERADEIYAKDTANLKVFTDEYRDFKGPEAERQGIQEFVKMYTMNRDFDQSSIESANNAIEDANRELKNTIFHGQFDVGGAVAALGAGDILYTDDNGELRLKAFQMKSADGKLLAEYTEDRKLRLYDHNGTKRDASANLLMGWGSGREFLRYYNALQNLDSAAQLDQWNKRRFF